jgi:hypothetical protein
MTYNISIKVIIGINEVLPGMRYILYKNVDRFNVFGIFRHF